MKAHGLPTPIFEANQKIFMVVLKNSENKATIKNSPYKRVINYGLLNERQIILVEYLNASKGRLNSRGDYMKLLNSKGIQITDLTASRDLKELANNNVLTKTGDTRGTLYYLT